MTDMNAKVKKPTPISVQPDSFELELFIKARCAEKVWSKSRWINELIKAEMAKHGAAQS